MTKYKSRLEDLPNEILTDIFKNLDARDLFRAFYNLTYRLNQLIQSYQYLQLYFHMDSSNVIKSNDEKYSYYVHTLTVDPWTNFNLKHFPHVHCLKLINPLPKVLEQLRPDVMPYLKHLSVSYLYDMYEIGLLHERIFSNCFSYLKSCELYGKDTIIKIPNSTQSPSLIILKTGYLDIQTYKTILSSCPNLYYLKFSLFPLLDNEPTYIQYQKYFKRIIIQFPQSDWFYNDDNILSEFLIFIPNLKILEIHRKINIRKLKPYVENYHWFSTLINNHLQRLKKFIFYFHLLKDDDKSTENIDEDILVQIETIFNHVHQGHYQAQLVIQRESL